MKVLGRNIHLFSKPLIIGLLIVLSLCFVASERNLKKIIINNSIFEKVFGRFTPQYELENKGNEIPQDENEFSVNQCSDITSWENLKSQLIQTPLSLQTISSLNSYNSRCDLSQDKIAIIKDEVEKQYSATNSQLVKISLFPLLRSLLIASGNNSDSNKVLNEALSQGDEQIFAKALSSISDKIIDDDLETLSKLLKVYKSRSSEPTIRVFIVKSIVNSIQFGSIKDKENASDITQLVRKFYVEILDNYDKEIKQDEEKVILSLAIEGLIELDGGISNPAWSDIRTWGDEDSKKSMAKLLKKSTDLPYLTPYKNADTFDGKSYYSLLQLTKQYPNSYLAKGFQEYRVVIGEENYFAHDPELSGRDPILRATSNLNEQLGKLLGFVEKYPEHPATNDADYRIARIYEARKDENNAVTRCSSF
jgi:hypothetical protein